MINPKDGTDYWIGGLDADKDKGMQWMTGMFGTVPIGRIKVGNKWVMTSEPLEGYCQD